MNTLDKVSDLRQVYTHNEDNLYFQYYPFSGVIRCHTRFNMFKVVHILGMHNIEVDWNKTNILKHTVQLPPLTFEQEEHFVDSILSFCQYYEDILSDEKYKNNIDRKNNKVLQWNSLKVQMSQMIKSKAFDRSKTAQWFNMFNIEDIRPEEPLIIISTKSKATIVEEGRKYIEKLYSQGRLIRCTKEEYKEKVEKYGNEK